MAVDEEWKREKLRRTQAMRDLPPDDRDRLIEAGRNVIDGRQRFRERQK